MHFVAVRRVKIKHNSPKEMLIRSISLDFRLLVGMSCLKPFSPTKPFNHLTLDILPKGIPLPFLRPDVLALKQGNKVATLGFEQCQDRLDVTFHVSSRARL